MGLCENQRRLRLLPFVINAGQEKHRMAIAEKIVTHYSMTAEIIKTPIRNYKDTHRNKSQNYFLLLVIMGVLLIVLY
jgi:hypothetical protein